MGEDLGVPETERVTVAVVSLEVGVAFAEEPPAAESHRNLTAENPLGTAEEQLFC